MSYWIAVASPREVHPGVLTGVPSVEPTAASPSPLTIRLAVSTVDLPPPPPGGPPSVRPAAPPSRLTIRLAVSTVDLPPAPPAGAPPAPPDGVPPEPPDG